MGSYWLRMMFAETQPQEVRLAALNAAVPTLNPDGTITATVARPTRREGHATLMALALPLAAPPGAAGGCFFLARCGAQSEWERATQWSFALRRPLFATTVYPFTVEMGTDAAGPAASLWELLVPPLAADCLPWLASLRVGSTLNLLGPFGQAFALQPLAHNLLLLADLAHLPLLFGSMEQMLDRNGRVTLVLRCESPLPDEIRSRLPIPVELRVAAAEEIWRQQLNETVRWADQIAAALPTSSYPFLADLIRQNRFRLESNFAQAFVETDLPCGVGACLACTVPLPDGSLTRGCIHGPVFDLATLYGK